MADNDKPVWYDIPDVSDKPIADEAIKAMQKMFEGAGWGAFFEMRRRQAEEAAATALDMNAPEEARALARARYASALFDLTLQERLANGVEKGEQSTEPPEQEESTPKVRPSFLRMIAQIFTK